MPTLKISRVHGHAHKGVLKVTRCLCVERPGWIPPLSGRRGERTVKRFEPFSAVHMSQGRAGLSMFCKHGKSSTSKILQYCIVKLLGVNKPVTFVASSVKRLILGTLIVTDSQSYQAKK